MTTRGLAEVLGTSVRVSGVRVGDVAGVFLDPRRERAIGLAVASVDGVRRFLPLFAATFEEGFVSALSALFLVDAWDSYERRGAVAIDDRAALSGVAVTPDGRIVRDGAVSSAVVTGTNVS